MKNIRVGISGWNYAPWRGPFYPKGLAQKDELRYTASKLSAIEVNGTFYRLQKPESFERWYEETPKGFVFTIKAPKYITHTRRLKEVETPLANFLASGILCLKEKLGAILWQFPPSMPFLPERFEDFLMLLPHTLKDAAKVAKGHSDWMKGRAVTNAQSVGPLRHAIEVRHHSFRSEDFVKLLRRYNVALVVGDTAGRWPYMEDITADFVYVRLHGDETKYPKGYTQKALDHWKERLEIWASGKDPKDAAAFKRNKPSKSGPRLVFAFLDNDHKTAAPLNAVDLRRRLAGFEEPKKARPAKAAKKKVAA